MIMIAHGLYFYTKYDTTLYFCEWKMLYITINRKPQINALIPHTSNKSFLDFCMIWVDILWLALNN